jgi:lysophospholipase L1-like esterase
MHASVLFITTRIHILSFCVHSSMMRAFVFILWLGCSCNKKTDAPNSYVLPVDTIPSVQTDTLKSYLALGDSYTIGQSVTEQERFPAQTVSLLKQQGIKIADPLYIAQTGWTTASLWQAITNQNPSPRFDIVSLLIGVNNQYQRMDTGVYAIHFIQLLDKAIQLVKGKQSNVFVLSIPDYSATPFVSPADKSRVSKEIDAFNTINKRITIAHGVSYTDITPSTREAATNSSLVAVDNLHPSGLEYKKWADLLVPKMKAVLQ